MIQRDSAKRAIPLFMVQAKPFLLLNVTVESAIAMKVTIFLIIKTIKKFATYARKLLYFCILV